MSLKKRILEKDPRLSIISSEVIQNIPCIEAVILCGSRAIIRGGKAISILSDYDVAIVMKTPLIPFYLRRIKVVEDKLSKEFGVKVNLNPLPTFRILNAMGNLFLFKVKKEGITIWGKDYISMLNPGYVKDIRTDCYFSYLSSLMKDLAQNLDPSFLHEFRAEHIKQPVNSATKALLGCAELLLLLRGIYETEPKAIVDKLSKYRRSEVSSNNFVANAVFLDSLRAALRIKENPPTEVDDPLEFCLSAKNRLLEMFRLLMRHFFYSHNPDLDTLVVEYLKATKGRSPLKNAEYSALTFLIKKEGFLKALFSKPLVVDRMRAALIWMLAAINEDRSLCRERLEKAYHILEGYTRIRCSHDETVLWRNIRYTILAYWPYSSTVMGI